MPKLNKPKKNIATDTQIKKINTEIKLPLVICSEKILCYTILSELALMSDYYRNE